MASKASTKRLGRRQKNSRKHASLSAWFNLPAVGVTTVGNALRGVPARAERHGGRSLQDSGRRKCYLGLNHARLSAETCSQAGDSPPMGIPLYAITFRIAGRFDQQVRCFPDNRRDIVFKIPSRRDIMERFTRANNNSARHQVIQSIVAGRGSYHCWNWPEIDWGQSQYDRFQLPHWAGFLSVDRRIPLSDQR